MKILYKYLYNNLDWKSTWLYYDNLVNFDKAFKFLYRFFSKSCILILLLLCFANTEKKTFLVIKSLKIIIADSHWKIISTN